MGQPNRTLKVKREKAIMQARYGKVRPSKRWSFDGYTDTMKIPSSVTRVTRVYSTPVERILLRNGTPF